VYVFAALTASCGSIAGMVDSAGRFIEGARPAEKVVEIYGTDDGSLVFSALSTKDGGRSGVFALKTLPDARFYCAEPDETGHFFITQMRFLFNGADGWQEGGIEAAGSGHFVKVGTSQAEFSLEGGCELGRVIDGAISRGDKRIYGERAAGELQNRKERIEAVVEWMRGQHETPEFDSEKEFEKYWTPVLFPETVMKKFRPPLYNGLGGKGEKITGEGVNWNAAYTEEIFPEYLWNLRNSGGLLRDWDEGAIWFYVEYCRNKILARLNGTQYLVRLN
jgi:hypothetical protein